MTNKLIFSIFISLFISCDHVLFRLLKLKLMFALIKSGKLPNSLLLVDINLKIMFLLIIIGK